MSITSSGLYEFGPFRLDVEQRVFTRAGEVLPLAPKTFDLLVLFLQRPGHAFSKQELMSALWPDAFVEEANLSFQVSTLRKAMGDGAARWIETLPKHGYRFSDDVRASDPLRAPEKEARSATQSAPTLIPHLSDLQGVSQHTGKARLPLMVTGRRAFDGEDISDTLAAVLRGEPEWTALPANVSPALVALLHGCLDKDRRRRVADLSTARFIFDREGDAVTAAAVSPASQTWRAAVDLGGGRGGGNRSLRVMEARARVRPVAEARTVPDPVADGRTVLQHGSPLGCTVSERWPHRVRREPGFVRTRAGSA